MSIFFSFDHQKYEKWGIVQAIEMHQLPAEVRAELEEEGFGVRWRDDAPFKSVDTDHSTECVNKGSKGTGGLTKLTQHEEASHR